MYTDAGRAPWLAAAELALALGYFAAAVAFLRRTRGAAPT